MNLRKNILLTLALLAANCLIISQAFATAKTYQHQVNISGATLFANYFSSPAGTNDYIDVNGDGIKGYNPADYNTPQQL